VAIEFAFLLPVVLGLLSGVVDWGWYLSREADLEDCTRDAARTGVLNTDASDPAVLAEQRLQESLSALGFDLAGATVTAAVEMDPTLDDEVLSVSVRLPHAPMIGLVPSPSELTAQVVMLAPS
jgi:Flp pilus assembly protein TadG